MRRYWAVGLVASSLTLAACGSTATINQAVTSIGSQADLQVHLSARVSGYHMARAQPVVKAISVDMNYSSTTGGPLSQSAGHANADVAINYDAHAVLEVRQVDRNLYVRIDVTPLSGIAGLGVTDQQLADFQLLLGGRWFEIPEDVITSLLPTTTINASQVAKEQATARAFVDALSALIERTPYKTLSGGGYSQTGSLSSVVKAVAPIVDRLTNRSAPQGSVKGTYTIAFTMAGAVATGASLSITAPNNGPNATLGVHTTLGHADLPVVAPSGATVISRTMLSQLMSQLQTSSSSLG